MPIAKGSELEKLEVPPLAAFRDSDPEMTEKIGSWLEDTESLSFRWDKFLAISMVDRVQSLSSKQGQVDDAVAGCVVWAEDGSAETIRRMCQFQSLLNDEDPNFLIDTATKLDVLQVGKKYFSVVNYKSRESDDNPLVGSLRRSGFFHPIQVCLSPPMEIYTGGAGELSVGSLRKDQLKGSVTKEKVTHALWEFPIRTGGACCENHILFRWASSASHGSTCFRRGSPCETVWLDADSVGTRR